jgi:2,4-dienoyl-CoA reductase-like NADH-dependent reductase (Old Yellow Enzyme family)
MRETIPDSLPLFVRISATDWAEGGWDLDESVEFARRAKEIGVDLIDVSSGGLVPKARIPVAPGYQVPLARRIRDEAQVKTGAVGLITETHHANELVTGGDADLVFIGRELLRDPYWALKTQQALGDEASWPVPYGYAVKRRAK